MAAPLPNRGLFIGACSPAGYVVRGFALDWGVDGITQLTYLNNLKVSLASLSLTLGGGGGGGRRFGGTAPAWCVPCPAPPLPLPTDVPPLPPSPVRACGTNATRRSGAAQPRWACANRTLHSITWYCTVRNSSFPILTCIPYTETYCEWKANESAQAKDVGGGDSGIQE